MFMPPTPASKNFRPTEGMVSYKSTRKPACDNTSAAINPAGPPPITATTGISRLFPLNCFRVIETSMDTRFYKETHLFLPSLLPSKTDRFAQRGRCPRFVRQLLQRGARRAWLLPIYRLDNHGLRLARGQHSWVYGNNKRCRHAELVPKPPPVCRVKDAVLCFGIPDSRHWRHDRQYDTRDTGVSCSQPSLPSRAYQPIYD